ncbi:MAG: hypothetical protein JWO52_7653 [Gammaproteobacteria bacterium]|jgi:type IV pilus assembly protein PilV|nr:hypothetical protein [Gammaproteobacteria bacterium]MDB6107654.1 hypothetical protein [Gammaproteobacteria bacterium]
MKFRYLAPRAAGFSLVEVMVALIVISVGLLGIAKMQALALSSTTTARLRSLAAIEAAGLASAMHANRAYWAALSVNPNIIVTRTSVTSADATLTTALTAAQATQSAASNYCNSTASAPCSAAKLAAADLLEWSAQMNTLLPRSAAVINCNTTLPLSCTVQITWSENVVAINKQGVSTGTAAAVQVPTYKLYVEP